MLDKDMNITTLEKSPGLMKELLKLIEDSFSYPVEHSFFDDFPGLFSKEHLDQNYILLDRERPIGHIGRRKRLLTNDHIQGHQCYFYGGLCLEKTYRGSGIFKSFFNHVLSKKEDKVFASFLWSDLEQMYTNFAFYEAGEIFIQKGLLDSAPKRTRSLSHIEDHDLGLIKSLHAELFSRFTMPKRSSHDWKAVLSSSVGYAFRDQNYYLKNKGYDLQGVIHESSSFSPQTFSRDESIWSPVSLSDGIHEEAVFTALIKIESIPEFNDFLQDYLEHPPRISRKINNEIHFNLNNIEYVLDEKDFVQGVFGPGRIKEFGKIDYPLYIPGIDSI